MYYRNKSFGVAPEVKEASKAALESPLTNLLVKAGVTSKDAANIAKSTVWGKPEAPIVMPQTGIGIGKGTIFAILGAGLLGMFFFFKRKK